MSQYKIISNYQWQLFHLILDKREINVLKNVFSALVILQLNVLISCSPLGSFSDEHEIHMEIDAEVKEAWIYLRVEGFAKDATYIVTRDDSVIFKKKLKNGNKLIHDINLWPSKAYQYKSYAKNENDKSDETELTITTMDSTISNFNISYQTINSAQFSQCWIWDKEDYWFIGEYYPNDSTGTSKGIHNILEYKNGNWFNILVKYDAGWPDPTPVTEVSGFWAFDKKNVWIAKYDIVFFNSILGQRKYDGDNEFALYGFDKNKIVYAGGRNNLLKLSQNEVYSFDLPDSYYISDLCGDFDEQLGLTVFDASKSNRVLLFLKDDKIEEIEYECLDYPKTLWFKNKNKVFLAGVDVNILKRDGSLDLTKFENITFITKIRGTDINNVFAITWGGRVYHFNGVRWTLICKVNARLNDIQMTDGFIIIVGIGIVNSVIIRLVQL